MTKGYSFYCGLLITSFAYGSGDFKPERIAMIGTGYVGLVTGTCFADIGHVVTCVDIDQRKIRSLQNNIIPIYEPHLTELIQKNVANQRLTFTTDLATAVHNANVIFIAVSTPTNKETGYVDLTIFEKAIENVVSHIDSYKVIVIKSTVPIGTGEKVRQELVNKYQLSPDMFDIISNPEFLREGSAVFDFMNPDRIVIGYSQQKALDIMKNIYSPFCTQKIPTIACNSCTAEAIKYASNIFLALKISFINEIANICRITGSNIKTVARAMGLDPRIGPHFLNPGPGFGGSCLPKDTQALICLAKKLCVDIPLINAIAISNTLQQKKAYDFTVEALGGNIAEKTITLLGLSFKANTDDIRESPAIALIKLLLDHHAHIKAYDPQAISSMQQIYPTITYCSSAAEAIEASDAIILLTEWKEFETINLAAAAACMHTRVIIDMRGIFDKEESIRLGFRYYGIQ